MMFKNIRFSLIAKILTLVFIIILVVKYHSHINPTAITKFIDKYGTVAPVIFIILCVLKPLLFFLPATGLTIVAGVLFGFIWGTIYVVIGGALSTIVGFYFARWLGKDTVKRLCNSNRALKKMDNWTAHYGKNAVLSMRMFNLPWDMVSYWAGCSNINFKDFYIASLIALVPISFLYTYFGSKLLTPRSWGFAASLLIIALLGMIPIVRQVLQKRRRRQRSDDMIKR